MKTGFRFQAPGVRGLVVALLLAALWQVLGAGQIPLGATKQVSWYVDVAVTSPSPGEYNVGAAPQAVVVYRNGLRMKACTKTSSPNCDYTLSGSVVTFAIPPASDDTLIFDVIR